MQKQKSHTDICNSPIFPEKGAKHCARNRPDMGGAVANQGEQQDKAENGQWTLLVWQDKPGERGNAPQNNLHIDKLEAEATQERLSLHLSVGFHRLTDRNVIGKPQNISGSYVFHIPHHVGQYGQQRGAKHAADDHNAGKAGVDTQ